MRPSSGSPLTVGTPGTGLEVFLGCGRDPASGCGKDTPCSGTTCVVTVLAERAVSLTFLGEGFR